MGQSRTKKMFKLGKYPALTASEAIKKVVQVLKWAEQGIDPKRVQEASIRKEEKVNEASRITFSEFLEEFYRDRSRADENAPTKQCVTIVPA